MEQTKIYRAVDRVRANYSLLPPQDGEGVDVASGLQVGADSG